MPSTGLSDKAIGVFAFAAYHQLTSGEPVKDVILEDGAGHKADPDAIRELEQTGLARVEGDRAAFTDAGKGKLQSLIEAMRGAG